MLLVVVDLKHHQKNTLLKLGFTIMIKLVIVHAMQMNISIGVSQPYSEPRLKDAKQLKMNGHYALLKMYKQEIQLYLSFYLRKNTNYQPIFQMVSMVI